MKFVKSVNPNYFADPPTFYLTPTAGNIFIYIYIYIFCICIMDWIEVFWFRVTYLNKYWINCHTLWKGS